MDFPFGKVHRVIARPEKIPLDKIYIFILWPINFSRTKKVKKKNDNQRMITKDRCKKSNLTLFYTDIISDDRLVRHLDTISLPIPFQLIRVITYSFDIIWGHLLQLTKRNDPFFPHCIYLIEFVETLYFKND